MIEFQGHPLLAHVNRYIRCFAEAGLIEYWIKLVNEKGHASITV